MDVLWLWYRMYLINYRSVGILTHGNNGAWKFFVLRSSKLVVGCLVQLRRIKVILYTLKYVIPLLWEYVAQSMLYYLMNQNYTRQACALPQYIKYRLPI